MRHRKACTIFALICTLWASMTTASTTDCQNLYIGRIWVEQGYGLFGVIFLSNLGDTAGSYWAHFNNWTAEDRKAALALLTSAKMMQHRVHVTTEAVGGCSIDSTNQQIKSLYLANDP